MPKFKPYTKQSKDEKVKGGKGAKDKGNPFAKKAKKGKK